MGLHNVGFESSRRGPSDRRVHLPLFLADSRLRPAPRSASSQESSAEFPAERAVDIAAQEHHASGVAREPEAIRSNQHASCGDGLRGGA